MKMEELHTSFSHLKALFDAVPFVDLVIKLDKAKST